MPKTPRTEIRAAILDAVERLLARYGYQKMTVDDVAREAEIAKGTLYAHFASKEEMALATIDRTIDLLGEGLREIAHSEQSVTERLERMLVFRILFLFDRVIERAHALDDMHMALRPQYKAHRDRYIQSEAEVFSEVLAEGRQKGELTMDDPFETATDFIFATSTLTPFSLSVRELGDRAEVEKKIRRISRLLLHGIAIRKD
jgi:AcrR family transcriptional regulator